MEPEEYADLLFDEIEYGELTRPRSFFEMFGRNAETSTAVLTIDTLLEALPEEVANRWRARNG